MVRTAATFASVLAVAAATLASGWPAAGAGVPEAARHSEAENRAAAQSDAAALLAGFLPPPGAQPLGAAPPGTVGSSTLATPDQADAAAWWSVPGTPHAVMQALRMRPPDGTKYAGSSSLEDSGRTVDETVTFGYPAVGGVLTTRWLTLSTQALGPGSTDLEVRALDVWEQPRPANETIPGGERLLRVSVVETLARRHVRQRFTVTAPARIARVIALLETLPAAQPGARACPVDFGIVVRLGFYQRRGAPASATAYVDPGGCGGVGLTVGGVTEPALESEPLPGEPRPSTLTLTQQIGRTLATRLRVG